MAKNPSAKFPNSEGAEVVCLSNFSCYHFVQAVLLQQHHVEH